MARGTCAGKDYKECNNYKQKYNTDNETETDSFIHYSLFTIH